MNDYRPLTTEEIEVLKHNDCWAEDWTSVNVSEDFKPNFMHRVMLYGEINIGSFNKNVEVSQGFVKHSAISSTTIPLAMIATSQTSRPWKPPRELLTAKEIL